MKFTAKPSSPNKGYALIPVASSGRSDSASLQIRQCHYPAIGTADTPASSDNRIILIQNRVATIDR